MIMQVITSIMKIIILIISVLLLLLSFVIIFCVITTMVILIVIITTDIMNSYYYRASLSLSPSSSLASFYHQHYFGNIFRKVYVSEILSYQEKLSVYMATFESRYFHGENASFSEERKALEGKMIAAKTKQRKTLSSREGENKTQGGRRPKAPTRGARCSGAGGEKASRSGLFAFLWEGERC